MPSVQTTLQLQFFDFLFGETDGYVCIATSPPGGDKSKFKQSFFSWPAQRNEMSTFIAGAARKNVWFCVNLLDAPERKKERCLPTNLVWADLDLCNPSTVDPTPQVVIESSPDRFQAFWILSEELPANVAEDYSKRIAYRYKDHGADPSGWDLTQLLRVPFTRNFKYGSSPEVKLLSANEETIEPLVFEAIELQEIKKELGAEVDNMPNFMDLPSPENVIYEYRHKLSKSYFSELYSVEPSEGDDWSKILWRLINILIETGMTREEAFVVAAASKCNKYERDKRPIRYLWREVIKAWNSKQAFAIIAGELDNALEFPTLVTEKECENLTPTFIDDYVTWGSDATDATPEYHELSGAILLSAVLADGLHVKTSFGRIVPNIWGLILGESTLTRKTTAMRMAMDFITDLDPTCLLATSGSVEGILSGLSERPSKASMFFKDEVAGFFSEIQRKDYLVGMAEALAHLYDCPAIDHRRLRKETITIVSPVFIFFGGGIRDRVYETVHEDLFYSGFLPRFLIVSGEADMQRVRPMGPPPSDSKHASRRDDLKIRLADLKELYTQSVLIKVGTQTTEMAKNIEAILTPEAWQRIASIETTLTLVANQSANPLITLPTFVRMSTSLLKLAMLIASTRQEPNADYKITVEERDIIHSAKYVQRWGVHTAHMLGNTGKTFTERSIDKILRCVREHPGITRSDVMRRHHLTSQEANLLFNTLDDRGLISFQKEGRGHRIFPI
jgi:hypothetical protein